jgi:hypothetical protein
MKDIALIYLWMHEQIKPRSGAEFGRKKKVVLHPKTGCGKQQLERVLL